MSAGLVSRSTSAAASAACSRANPEDEISCMYAPMHSPRTNTVRAEVERERNCRKRLRTSQKQLSHQRRGGPSAVLFSSPYEAEPSPYKSGRYPDLRFIESRTTFPGKLPSGHVQPCPDSQRLQLRGSDGFTPPSRHQIPPHHTSSHLNGQ